MLHFTSKCCPNYDIKDTLMIKALWVEWISCRIICTSLLYFFSSFASRFLCTAILLLSYNNFIGSLQFTVFKLLTDRHFKPHMHRLLSDIILIIVVPSTLMISQWPQLHEFKKIFFNFHKEVPVWQQNGWRKLWCDDILGLQHLLNICITDSLGKFR